MLQNIRNIRILTTGGCWSTGSMAGVFALELRDPIIAFGRGCWRPHFCALDTAPTEVYPAYITPRWIYLAKHAKKAITRKKWKNQIARKIKIYKKRNKGAIA